MQWRRWLWVAGVSMSLPAGFSAFAEPLRAYYTRIESGEAFERFSRTGPYADIVVETEAGRLGFWRGSSYLPFWETEQGKWFVEELFARRGDGPAERPDRVNTFSRVIIAENTPDRVIICWRYLPQFSGDNPKVGMDAARFVEECFEILPDGSVTRTARQGTPRVDAWRDPLNRTVQTFRLTPGGIRAGKVPQRPAESAPADPVQGHPMLRGYVAKPARSWHFDEAKGDIAVEEFTGHTCEISGHKSLWKPGISGTALQFDGYTSSVELPSTQAPDITGFLTLEAWAAIGAYPWNWAPIVQQCDEVPADGGTDAEETGYFLGIDGLGRAGLKLKVGATWEELVSERTLDRRQWYHLAGTYDREAGTMCLYIDGRLECQVKVAGDDIQLSRKPVKIGKGKPRRPIRPVRANTFVDEFTFDGLIDEVRIYDVALTGVQVRQSYHRCKPDHRIVENPAMDPRRLPAGEQRGTFGAYYRNLPFYETWDNLWRFGDYPDVVVEFDQSPARFVFWRGAGYIPMLVNEKGHWYSNEFNETWNKSGGRGCQEPMSDKESYMNHVRILENTPARVVVHWRYPLVDVNHVIANYEDENGWGDWADWYYTIYPDGVAVKKMHLWTHGERNHEWQEGMAILGPDQHPEQVLETAPALLLADLDGHVDAYDWMNGPPRKVDYSGKKIHVVNYRADYDPFTIADIQGGGVYSGEVTDYAVFPSWNHWPVGQMPSDGRYASFPDRTAHCSLTHIGWPAHKEADGDRPYYQKLMLEGMSDKAPGALAPLARSWLDPAPIRRVAGATDARYDPAQRAYIMTAAEPRISFRLAASSTSPLVNPCIVIRDWKDPADASVALDERIQPPGPALRQGTTLDTDGRRTRIIWIQIESESPVNVDVSRAESTAAP